MVTSKRKPDHGKPDHESLERGTSGSGLSVRIDGILPLESPRSLRFNVLVSDPLGTPYLVIEGFCVRKGRISGPARKTPKGRWEQNPLIGPAFGEAVLKEFMRSGKTVKYRDWVSEDPEEALRWLVASPEQINKALPGFIVQ
jgi:hypothetical protein